MRFARVARKKPCGCEIAKKREILICCHFGMFYDLGVVFDFLVAKSACNVNLWLVFWLEMSC